MQNDSVKLKKPLFCKKITALIAIFVLLASYYPFPQSEYLPQSLQTKTAEAASPSWAGGYGDWAYRKPIPVSGSAAWGAPQTNYQVPVNPSVEEVFDKTGLVGDWNFDEGGGTSAKDLSGQGNNGTLNNSAAWTSSGKFNSAFSGNGSSHNVSTDAFGFDYDYITVEAWVNSNNLSSRQTIFNIPLHLQRETVIHSGNDLFFCRLNGNQFQLGMHVAGRLPNDFLLSLDCEARGRKHLRAGHRRVRPSTHHLLFHQTGVGGQGRK